MTFNFQLSTFNFITFNFILFEDISAWFIVPCVILGLLYAFILYRKNPDELMLKRVLFAFRFIVVTIIAVLLLSPLFKSAKKILEKPIIIFAADNSASLPLSTKNSINLPGFNKKFLASADDLSGDYDVKKISFADSVKDNFTGTFTGKETDFSTLFNYIKQQYADRNIGAVVLYSDGIVTKGSSNLSTENNLKFPVYTIPLGDTVPQKDLLISGVTQNNLVYLGNDHEVIVNVAAYKSKGQKSVLKLVTNDGQSQQKPINITNDNFNADIKFIVNAKKKGSQKLSFSFQPLSQEITEKNNVKLSYTQVIDGRQRILLLANSPHPDIAALKQAISANKNYDLKTFIYPDLPPDVKQFDLVILHQLPSANYNPSTLLSQLKNRPVLYILGEQTNIAAFNSAQNLLKINNPTTTQEVLPLLKTDFYSFSLSDSNQTRFAKLPPLIAPLGIYQLQAQANVLLNQKIGQADSGSPLLVFSSTGIAKTAVLSGEGLWRWRLNEYQEFENHAAVDELITKTIQYLAAKDDQRKLRVYTASETFNQSDRVILNAELYNDAFELVNDAEVKITLKSSAGKTYSYVFSKQNKAYTLNAGLLSSGDYTYEAKTNLGSKNYTDVGAFTVIESTIEYLQTAADYQFLYQLASNTNGKMIKPSEIDKLKNLLQTNENIKTISYEDKSYRDLIENKWVLALILLLLTAEWFLRKRNGMI